MALILFRIKVIVSTSVIITSGITLKRSRPLCAGSLLSSSSISSSLSILLQLFFSDMPATFSGIFLIISRSNSADYLCHIKNDLDEVSEVTITYFNPPQDSSPFPLTSRVLNIGEVYHISGEFRIENNCFMVTLSHFNPLILQ
jgi:hypothetical protein